ncbi:thiol-disulfide oxidoreductase DCC family protein [Parahaliea aestuarii]|uniref:Thiol-disulfide oxidoreductase DCC family protein n=1 Tax=Parahaliea aestuarii TaxID=1852021 RepID=A0A5C8ZXB5_9GAMM|nr:thiol-disulfide oxidoreductase DCC family protein [Parahaliea aestuarii]TXS92404.1 thiol-disulfide oxidoreductase DCC family protein [Parahaliea aestuarii]
MSKQTEPGSRVVLFDGVCKLCSAWTRFLIRFDRKHRFKLATVQSPEGQALLARHGFPTDTYETMVLVEGSKIHTRSAAFLGVMRRLPFPWPLVCVAWLIPRFIRDWLYDRIALNRYRLFGRYDTCFIPDSEQKARFLGGD